MSIVQPCFRYGGWEVQYKMTFVKHFFLHLQNNCKYTVCIIKKKKKRSWKQMYDNPSHHFYILDRELLPLWHLYFYLCVCSFMESGTEVTCEILLFLGLKSYTKTRLAWLVVVIVCFSRTFDWSNTSVVQRCQALNLQTPNEIWVLMFGWEADLLGMRLFCVTSVVACFYFQKLCYVYIFQGCRHSHASE